MLRYIGLLWDSADGEAGRRLTALVGSRLSQRGRQPSEWRVLLHQPGLAVVVATQRPFACYSAHLLAGGAGAVVGVLFDRQGSRSSDAADGKAFFDARESERVARSGGRRLVEAYWGRYVAFLSDSASGCRRILRSPLGDVPCSRASMEGVDVYFSSLADFMQLQSPRLTVNWEHLAARVITGNAWADESALNEVETVHPGECFEHRGREVSRKYYWHPFAVARSAPIEDPAAAVQELRAVTRACTDAWGSLHESVVHVLSGGLDSSIVLGCLARSGPRSRVTCLNFRTHEPNSDERVYARLAAERAGCELVETERTSSLALERLFECAPGVGPVDVVMRGLEVQPQIARFARSRGATAVFSGDGGDLIFFRGWPQLALFDYAWQHGVGPGLARFAFEVALPAQLSVWRLLKDAIRYGVLRQNWDVKGLMFDHYRLVTDAVVADVRRKSDFLNPWKLPVDDLPPGKRFHAFGASRPTLFRDPLPGPVELDFINPLMSQPVVEVCLRIPTYIHAAHGQDRAVARAAFAADLPLAIAQRTWKGAADRHLKDLMVSNIKMIREVLLDGALVKGGLLDRERLGDALSGAPTRSTAHPTEIFGYVCTEVWLRHWASGARVTSSQPLAG